MIEYNSKVWFRHITEFRKMDTLRILAPELIIIALYVGILVAIKDWLLAIWITEPTALEQLNKSMKDITVVHSILGFVLSLLLVFRTNTAYERWWEGRKLWGSLVNNTRNLAVRVQTVLGPESQGSKQFLRMRIADFCFALKGHLRDNVLLDEFESMSTTTRPFQGATRRHIPMALVQELYAETKALYDARKITGDELIVWDQELKSLSDILGACERIRKTPIPFTYSLFLKKFIVFYIATLPIGFAALFDFWAVPITAFVFYVLVSLEIIAEEIEDPFGEDTNDLPTQHLSEMIRHDVNEIIGAAE